MRTESAASMPTTAKAPPGRMSGKVNAASFAELIAGLLQAQSAGASGQPASGEQLPVQAAESGALLAENPGEGLLQLLGELPADHNAVTELPQAGDTAEAETDTEIETEMLSATPQPPVFSADQLPSQEASATAATLEVPSALPDVLPSEEAPADNQTKTEVPGKAEAKKQAGKEEAKPDFKNELPARASERAKELHNRLPERKPESREMLPDRTDTAKITLPSRAALEAPAFVHGKINPVRAAVVEQVLEQMVFTQDGAGESTVTVRLKPAVLGKVEIRLTLEEGRLTGKVLTDNVQVKEVLEAALGQLRERLESQQIRVAEFTVTVAGEEQFSRGRHFSRGHGPRNGVAAFEQPAATVLNTTAAGNIPGLVDVLA